MVYFFYLYARERNLEKEVLVNTQAGVHQGTKRRGVGVSPLQLKKMTFSHCGLLGAPLCQYCIALLATNTAEALAGTVNFHTPH